jgi:hypothetical protein
VGLASGQDYDAKVVGRDPKTDLALIRIDEARDLHPLKLGNSEDLEVGSWVVAVGSSHAWQSARRSRSSNQRAPESFMLRLPVRLVAVISVNAVSPSPVCEIWLPGESFALFWNRLW